MESGNRLDIKIIIVGPTGVGKTELAILLAEHLGGEIISADSRQIFRKMDIGTDKPPLAARKRVPHHLIDVAEPDEYYSAGKFARAAQRTLKEIFSRENYQIIAGGAGLYLRALADGLFPEDIKDHTVKARLHRELEENGAESLYTRLSSEDPSMASRLKVNDTQRIIRALEVLEVTGRSLTEQWQKSGKGIAGPLIFFGLNRDRDELYRRIEKRVDHMIDTGLLDEVKDLRSQGYGRNLNSQKSVGYREAHEYLDRELSYENMIRLIKQRSRNYAKRQLTWFRKDQRIRWIHWDRDSSGEKVLNDLLRALKEENL